MIACAGGHEIVLSGDGLGSCTLASAQRVGAFDFSAGTRIRFIQGRVDRLEMPATSSPLTISGLSLPPSTVVHLCEQSPELDWVLVPDQSYVVIRGVKLTGRMNFDCGKFEYGTLFEATARGSRRLPRGTTISSADLTE